MAIDSDSKKASLLNFALPWFTVGPLFDTSIGNDEQQHLLHLYNGFTPGAPPVGGGMPILSSAGIHSIMFQGSVINGGLR